MSHLSVQGEQSTASEIVTLTNLTALSVSPANQFIRKTGDTTFENSTPSEAGLGDVTGPSSSTTGNFVSFNGSTGKIIKDSGYNPSNFVTSLASVLALNQSTSQTIVNGQPIWNTLTASELIATDGNKKFQSLAVATYPSLTEVSYVKGVTSAIQTQLNGKENFHGIQAAGALSFDNSGHILTIAAGTNTYWYKGTRYTTSSAITCDLDSFETLTTNKLYYFYFDDATGTLKCNDSGWSFKDNVFVATVFWNGTAGAVQNEKHLYTRDLDWHEWAHDTIGTRYQSGLDVTNPTTVNDALLQIETGVIHDEDLDHTTGQQTTMRGWYKASASVYTFADYSLPYVGTSGQPQWLRTSDYTLQNVGATDFVCMWVYATGDVGKPIYMIPTHAAAAHNNITAARNETTPVTIGTNLNPEFKLIYKFIYKGDGNFQELVDYRTSSALPGGGVPNVAAGGVTFTPYGDIAAGNVQAALQELDDEKMKGAGTVVTGNIVTFNGTTGKEVADSGYALGGNLTETTSGVLTITGGDAAVIGSGTTITVQQATTSTSGYLSDTDWNTFNGKGDGDMLLGTSQSVTALKTFDKDMLAMKGTSTGITTISTANTSGTSYTLTMQAKNGTIACQDDVTYIGTTSVALNRSSAALTLAGITLTTPDIGTPSAGTLTNCTGYAADINLPAGKQINLTLPTTDATCTGHVSSSWNSGYSSAVGDLVFFGSGGKWLEVDADAVATCQGLMGIALEAKTDGQAMKVALPGSMVHLDAWNWTVGATLYAGETLGAMQEAIPTGGDAIIRVVGFAVDADTIFFNPSSDQQSVVA